MRLPAILLTVVPSFGRPEVWSRRQSPLRARLLRTRARTALDTEKPPLANAGSVRRRASAARRRRAAAVGEFAADGRLRLKDTAQRLAQQAR